MLVTAHDAYPRLERLFLSARSSIRMGFRIFDMRTKLRSDEGRQIGKTWVDLFVHTLNRGVPVDLTLSDFDPVMAPDMHAQAWRLTAISYAINELTAPGAATMSVRCLLHPCQGGLLPRLFFAPKTRKQISATARELTDKPYRLRFLPGLRDMLRQHADGRVTMVPNALPRLYPVSLHHKMAVFDDDVTYIGGLDLNERRYDGPDHDRPAQRTWHDVQLVVTDKDLAENATEFLETLPDVVTGDRPATRSDTAFRQTLSRKRRNNLATLSPHTVAQSLLDEHVRQIDRAETLIYIETQFFRDRRIAAALVRAAKRAPDLRLIMLLPAAPEEAAFHSRPGLDARFGEFLQLRCFRQVRRAFGNRFIAVSPVQPRRPDERDKDTERATLHDAPIVYVHAKVLIVDGKSAIVSSANLNGRSMKWDAETGVLLDRPDRVLALQEKLFETWLTEDAPAECHEIATAFDGWRDLAFRNLDLPPEDRTGFIVPYAPRAGAKIATPVPGAPEEIV